MKEELRRAAEDLIGRGWCIFPVGGDDGKKPQVKWLSSHTKDMSQVDAWLRLQNFTGWGVVCGKFSGIVVIDIDGDYVPEEVTATPTYAVSTPSGGWHFYYSASATIPNSAGRLGPKVDVRGDGGYVVGAGSFRPDGGRYEAVGGDVAPCPAEIVRKACEKPAASPGSLTLLQRPISDLSLREKAERYAARCRPAVSGAGGHNQALCVARAMVQGFGLGEEDALQAMWNWNQGCHPPWSEKELRHKILSAIDTPDPQGRPHGYLLEERNEVIVIDDDADLKPEGLKPKPDPFLEDEEREELAVLLAEQGDIARHFLRHLRGKCRIWQPGLATGATLALGATLAGRRWHWNGMTSHLYVLGVAGSACGKDVPMKALSQALGEQVIAGMPSVKALRDALEEASDKGQGACLVSGEIAKLLRQILGGRAPAYLALAGQILLELGTWGTEPMRFERAASDRMGGEARQQVLDAPCLSIFGTATPEDLLTVLGEASLRDGLLGRFLVFRAQHILPDKRQPTGSMEDRGLTTVLADLDRARQNWLTTSEAMVAPKPEPIPSTNGQTLADYDLEIHRARQIGDIDVPDELMGRQAEHAHRVAIAIAGLSSSPRITAQGEALAVRIVERCAGDLWSLANRHAAGNSWERGLKRVLSSIEKQARADGYVRKRDILRAVRDRDCEAWIAALIAEGSLVEREAKARNGRSVLAYRLA
jgi:hypothetical protein